MIRLDVRCQPALFVPMPVASSALAADAIESKPVRLAKGASSAAIKRSIKGDQTIDDRLRGKPGNAEVYVTPPGGLPRVLTVIGGTTTSAKDAKVRAGKVDGIGSIEVNDVEHYRIPEFVVSDA